MAGMEVKYCGLDDQALWDRLMTDYRVNDKIGIHLCLKQVGLEIFSAKIANYGVDFDYDVLGLRQEDLDALGLSRMQWMRLKDFVRRMYNCDY